MVFRQKSHPERSERSAWRVDTKGNPRPAPPLPLSPRFAHHVGGGYQATIPGVPVEPWYTYVIKHDAKQPFHSSAMVNLQKAHTSDFNLPGPGCLVWTDGQIWKTSIDLRLSFVLTSCRRCLSVQLLCLQRSALAGRCFIHPSRFGVVCPSLVKRG